MSAEVKAQIARDLATLVQITDFPVAPFGYGSDISGDFDVDPTAREVKAFTTLALAQALVRRLDCPRGALPDDKDYGVDLRSYCNRGVTANDLRSLGGQIKGELQKDDRVDTVTVRLAPSSTGTSLLVELAIRPVDARIGGFSLTLSASSASVLLEEIKAV
jgi:hypothetical protein